MLSRIQLHGKEIGSCFAVDILDVFCICIIGYRQVIGLDQAPGENILEVIVIDAEMGAHRNQRNNGNGFR